jgi:diguanylate cyclase
MLTDNATTDPLTGLTNRRRFEEKLNTAISEAEQHHQPLSLGFFDIDHFLELNTTLGHEGGNVLLKALADIVKRMAGEKAVVCRYGGDEFTLLFPATEREQAFLILEGIRAEIEKQQSFSDGNKSISTAMTITGGIAAYPIDAQSANELVRKADEALYRAKAAGRNKVTLSYEEKMAPKTSHFTLTQLERLTELAREQGVGEAILLREALDDLLIKYNHAFSSHKR